LLRILSLSSVYPNPDEPGLGVFIKSRLQQMARLAEIKVVAPVPIIDYSRLRSHRLETAWIGGRRIPRCRHDDSIEVHHVRWAYPPGGTVFNPICEFGSIYRTALGLRNRFAYELIDAHFAFPEGVAAALLSWRTGLPFTVTLRGNETMHIEHRSRRGLIRWALRRAGRVIAVSRNLREFALGLGVSPERVITIPNGVDSCVYFPRDRRECRRKHGLPESAPLILSAGTLIERKGHHRIIEVLPRLIATGIPAVLIIAGGAGREGHFEQVIRDRVRTLQLDASVVMTGHVPPHILSELMSAADVLCLASTREGWPNVVHEALACGTPAVATDIGGVRDMIPDENHGFVIPPDDGVALESALKRALRTTFRRDKIAERAQARSWDQVALEVIAEMTAVCSEHNHSASPI
jgi:teichuronic acid biosynthesis glycosyltransferase TuaC